MTSVTLASGAVNSSAGLDIKINSTTKAVSLNTSGAVGVGSTPNYGTAGQVLTSAGTGAAPTWSSDISGNAATATASTTASSGDNSTKIATTAFVTNAAFSSALPSQTGNAGKYVTTDGSVASWGSLPAGVLTNAQTFTSSGTWTKPTGANWVQVVMWGAGGSGGNWASSGNAGNGGGGGMYFQQIFPASSLTSTVTVTVGAGGAGQSTNDTLGNNGGDTTFGSYATSFGGKAGLIVGQGGGAGGAFTLGGTSTGGISGLFDASGGGGGNGVSSSGGASLMGGGGGGSASGSNTGAGGVSSFGGNGGAGSRTGNATAGTAPGGGGGGVNTSAGAASSGAGGAGKVIVYTW